MPGADDNFDNNYIGDTLAGSGFANVFLPISSPNLGRSKGKDTGRSLPKGILSLCCVVIRAGILLP